VTQRRLDLELVRRGLAPSRTEAQRLIADGVFSVSGAAHPKQTMRVDSSTAIKKVGALPRYVGRGGLKLEHALEAFSLSPAGLTAADIGASTGGFTDCLIQRGAKTVAAIDVGSGQLASRLRSHPQVSVFESCNVRDIDVAEVDGPFGLVVCDVSFISLVTIRSALVRLGSSDAHWILLVKPQFEVGKGQLGGGGIVRDRASHRGVLEKVINAYASLGVGSIGLTTSPIAGAKGNREYLVHLRRGAMNISTERLEEVTT
jgi:23S rRNA (cytidine1920-2'-O)/16S rRNA (cytidine1409-2'-O)-methyltransferase